MSVESGRSFDITWSGPAKRALGKLPEKVATAVVEFVYGALASNPHRVGKPMYLDMLGKYTARRGEYRVIYVIDPELSQVEIFAVKHRSEAYRPA